MYETKEFTYSDFVGSDGEYNELWPQLTDEMEKATATRIADEIRSGEYGVEAPAEVLEQLADRVYEELADREDAGGFNDSLFETFVAEGNSFTFDDLLEADYDRIVSLELVEYQLKELNEELRDREPVKAKAARGRARRH